MHNLKSDTVLPLMEYFYTIQGEGFYQGSAAFFIRLGGCDVGCVWCDVKESWDANLHPQVKVTDILKLIEAELPKGGIVVITGGEPLMYNLQFLTFCIKEAGYRTHIETSGAYPLTGTWDWICVSPKKFKPVLDVVLQKAHELKIIVFNKSDFDFALQNQIKCSSNCQLYLQPEWSKKDEMTPLIIEFVKKNPVWQVCLQIHKFMNIP